MLWGMDEPPLETGRTGLVGYALLIVRGLVVGGVTYGGLVLLLLVRLIEWPIFRSAQARNAVDYPSGLSVLV